ncbi:MAG: hypothetical protein JSW28_07370 [Thermoplasmata archaeon]|nr:MAG: hypothetical protein JSW28_07370 [Thermoplasmata archaeon]
MVTVTETQTGVYEGTYTIQASDEMLYITAQVTKGTDDEIGVAVIPLGEQGDDEGELDVDIRLDDPEDYFAEPGDTVEITVTVKYNDILADPDSFSLTINEEALTYTKTGNGTYTATKSIPSSPIEGNEFEIEAEATKGSETVIHSESFYVVFYTVYYHNVSKSNTTSTFDIYVGDLEGNAVSGATVNISYDDDDNVENAKAMQEQTTDSNGKTTFTTTYTDRSSLEIEGKVTKGEKSQKFKGEIHIEDVVIGPPQEDPSDTGFDVVYTGAFEIYEPGESVTREYTAYYDSDPWASKEVYYYITDGDMSIYTIIKKGTVNTDVYGEFTLTFSAPSKMGTIFFETGRPKTAEDDEYDEDDDLVYEEDFDIIYVGSEDDIYGDIDWEDDHISVSISSLVHGGKTTVTVTATDVPSGAQMMAIVLYGRIETVLDMVTAAVTADWQYWIGLHMTPLTKTNGDYTGEVIIPDFMPENEYYTVMAGWYDGGIPHYNKVVLKPGSGGGTPPPLPPTGEDLGTLESGGESATIDVGKGAAFDHAGKENSALLKSVSSDSATLQIHSTSETVTVNVGETKEVDTNDNGQNDLAITVDSVNTTSQSATLTFKPIAEEEEEGMNMMIILAVVVVLIVIVVVIAVAMRKKSP